MARRILGPFDRQCAQVAMRAHLHDASAVARRNELRQFRRDLGQCPTDRIIALLHQNCGGRSVEQLNFAVTINRQYASADAGQDRLDEGAPLVQLTVRAYQRARLRFQPLCHPVKRGRKRADLIAALQAGNARRQVARRDPPRRRHQFIDRPHHPVRHRQRDIDGNADQQQRSHEQGDVEPQLQRARLRREQVIVRDHRLRPLRIGEGRTARIARDV